MYWHGVIDGVAFTIDGVAFTCITLAIVGITSIYLCLRIK